LFKKIAEDAQKLYYSTQFNLKTKTTKELWANLNTVCSFKSKKSNRKVSRLQINDRIITNTQEMADGFNKYFSQIGAEIALKLDGDPGNTHLCFKQYCHPSNQNSMFCEPTTKSEVLEIINGLQNNKSPGSDNIGSKLLKSVSYELIQPLTYICNLSFETGTVPDALKIGKVIPILKRGESMLPSNYRPISLLSVFDKILEKLMLKRLTSFLNKNKILYEHQFGFRKRHSTTLALIEAIDNIYKLLDQNETVIGLYLDLEKAFDTVNHEILLYKLNNYGIRGTSYAWFKNYLTNRKQFVSLDGISSHLENISCGVPQGSILGPILFLIYINDMHNAVPERNIKLFADDANIFIHSKTIQTTVDLTKRCITNIHSWCTANKLSINFNKTNFSVFSRTAISNYAEITIGRHTIKRTTSSKYLGVIIDEKLNWSEHIEYIYNKLVRFTGIAYRLRSKIPVSFLKNIYYGLIHPNIIYGLEIYGNTTISHLDKLIKLNNKLLRILQFKTIETSNAILYRNYNSLPIPSLFKYKILTLVHNFKHHKDKLPVLFKHYFTENSTVHSYIRLVTMPTSIYIV